MTFSNNPIVSAVMKTALLVTTFGVAVEAADAHEVPTDVVVQTIIKPERDRLDLLVRVPLEAMRDVTFPETGPGYLVISEADPFIRDAATVWIAQEVTLYENDEPLADWTIEAARLAVPSDRSFDNYESALATVTGQRLADSENLVREQALLDVLIRYPITSRESEFSIAPAFARLGLETTTVVRYLHPDGTERIFQFPGDPGVLRLDPRWHHAFFRFVGSGIEHILDGVDHLLFVICLLIPFRRIRPLVVIITSFTVAHSITLIASAFVELGRGPATPAANRASPQPEPIENQISTSMTQTLEALGVARAADKLAAQDEEEPAEKKSGGHHCRNGSRTLFPAGGNIQRRMAGPGDRAAPSVAGNLSNL